MPKSLPCRLWRVLRAAICFAFALEMVHLSSAAMAQEPPRAASDPRIAAILPQVSPDRIRQTVEKLVSFGNRSTISAQDDESIKSGKGIGAAREWIKQEE